MEIDLSFLKQGIKYKAYLLTDDPEKNNDKGFRAGDATACNYETIDVTHSTLLKVDLAQGGGVAIHIFPDPNGSSLSMPDNLPMTAWYDKREQKIHVNTANKEMRLTLHDMQGRTLKTRLVNGECTIPVETLAKGIYTFTCSGKDCTGSIKFYKQ